MTPGPLSFGGVGGNGYKLAAVVLSRSVLDLPWLSSCGIFPYPREKTRGTRSQLCAAELLLPSDRRLCIENIERGRLLGFWKMGHGSHSERL